MAASETEGRTEYPKRLVENDTDDESSGSDDEELEQAYEMLYKESLNLSKLNDKLTTKLKTCENSRAGGDTTVLRQRKDDRGRDEAIAASVSKENRLAVEGVHAR
ncbi:hypothetical protein ACSBR1_028076 [Camellia fascicularis]